MEGELNNLADPMLPHHQPQKSTFLEWIQFRRVVDGQTLWLTDKEYEKIKK